MKVIKQVTIILIMFLSLTSVVKAQTATITWTDVHQTIDGFGGQTWRSADNLTDFQADMFFSPTNGIGLEYVRTANTADGSVPDLVTLQEAVARGAKVELGLQSPPASMKVSGSFNDGTGGIIEADFGAYATYIINWIKMLASNGVPVDVVSVQNEPNITPSSLGACIWTASQFQNFVRNFLGPALASAGLSTKIMIGEGSGWFGTGTDFVSTSLNDAPTAAYISIAAAHGYGSDGAPDGFTPQTGYCCSTASLFTPALAAGKHIWQSEINGGFTFNGGAHLWVWDPSMTDALVWAHNIHDYFTVAQVSGYEYWELADCCGGGLNDGLTDGNFTPAKRMYVVGNYSKFIRPGWVRIGATADPTGGVLISAYKDPGSGTFAIVAINQNGSDVPMNFVLSGFTAAYVTPWVTSANLNLFQQSTFTVGGSSFSATLPAASVTTFVSSGQLQTPTPTPTPAPTQTPTPTTDTLTLNLSEDAFQGDAHFYATIDGVFLTTQTAVTTLHDSGQTQAFTFTGNWGAGPHTIVITFLDDAYGGTPQTDRNLYAYSISYDGVLYASPQTMWRVGDTATFTTNVTVPPPTLIPTPTPAPTQTPTPTTDTLTLNLSEDAFQGDAHFYATIDGVFLTTQTAVTTLHDSGQTQAFTFTGNWGAGPHTIVITFLDDAYGGTPQTDRNLYAYSISYDGVLYASPQTMWRVGDMATFTIN